ncbi:MAG: chemotaxis protein CheA, partial [Planctomycetota bacterium]
MGGNVIDALLREFLEESFEHLARLEVDLVSLEKEPEQSELIDSAYRALHTIKGNCGFLALPRLEKIAHAAESLLARLRDGDVAFRGPVATLLLRTVDVLRVQLEWIGRGEGEAPGEDGELIAALEAGEPVEAAAPAPARVESHTVRVDTELLDTMMNLVGELVLMRNRVVRTQIEGHQESERRAARRELDRLTTRLQEAVMHARMDPVGRLFERMPRLVRDLASELGKEIDLVTSGDETELDRSILETMTDPLTHLLRNAIDHGIERRGTVTLAAFQSGSQVVLEVRDDGRGIDRRKLAERGRDAGLPVPERVLDLVFEPGLTTADEVSRISGRGVGMDVVRDNVERLGGRVEIESVHGEGTTVRVRLPLTLAIVPGIVVACGGQRFVIPQRHLREMLRVRGRRELERLHDAPVYRLRGRLLPVFVLDEELGIPSTETGGAALAVLEADGRRYGLFVDRILDTQEIVVKPLGSPLDRLPYYGGATTLGEGEVALILEVGGLAAHAGVR